LNLKKNALDGEVVLSREELRKVMGGATSAFSCKSARCIVFYQGTGQSFEGFCGWHGMGHGEVSCHCSAGGYDGNSDNMSNCWQDF
jgi:hypothetical protein